MALTIDQAQQLAMMWANAASFNSLRASAPTTFTDEIFVATAQEAWDAMVAAAAPVEPPA